MTDWDRVEKLRAKGLSWSEIAEDPKASFQPPAGADPGRALRSLYYQRQSRAGSGRRGDEPGAGVPRRATSSHSLRSILLTIAAVAIVLSLVAAYFVIYHPAPPSSDVVTYCGGEGSSAHYHTLLVIEDNGVQEPLPYQPGAGGDIGFLDSPEFTNPSLYCPSGGIHALHTHDGSGIIHAELPSSVTDSGITPTLGDFFTIWGQNLTSSHVWTYSGHLTATVLDSDNGKRSDYSSDPASIPLSPSSQGPTANPYPIPSNWIFNGQYGGGASGGYFAGEIIWLNVTSA